MNEVQFNYVNRRGEIELRTVIPDAIEFLTWPHPDWLDQPGWFLSGFDMDKQARRTFALNKIVLDKNVENFRFKTPKGFPMFTIKLGEKL